MFLSGVLNNRAAVFALIIFSVALAGCGGGGGGSPSPGPGPGSGNGVIPPPPGPANLFDGFSDVSASEVATFETTEYANQPGLGMINAAYAYARGAANMGFGSGTGASVTIGVIDSGLDTTHSDFVGKVDSASRLTYPYSPTVDPNSVVDITNSEVEGISVYPAIGCNIPGLLFAACSGNLFFAPALAPFFTRDADGTIRRLPTSAYRTACPIGEMTCQAERGRDGAEEFLNFIIGEIDHGTFVGSIAAGAQGGGQTEPIHGVAFGARLLVDALSLDFPLPNVVGPYRPFGAEGEATVQSLADAVLRQNLRARVVNVSLVFDGPQTEYGQAGFPQTLRNRFGSLITAIEQTRTLAARRTIYVFAAGNEGEASPGVIGVLPIASPQLEGDFLTVVSVDAQGTRAGQISDFSNRCGVAAAWCLAAPGGSVRGNYSTLHLVDPDRFFTELEDTREATRLGSGTSFAAPHVTGAIAVLIDFFGDRLGHHEIVQRLLATADKSDIYADQAIYGQGLLDLRAATEPVGATSLLTGTSLSGPSVAAAATRLLNGAAFGDAWTNAFRDHVLSVFDELDAPFPARLTDFVSSPARGLLFDAALSQLGRTDLPHHRVLDNGVKLSFSSSTFLASGAVQLGSLSDRRRWFASYGVHPGLAISSHTRGYSLSPTRTDEFLAPWLGFATDGLSVGATLPFGSFKLTVAGFDGYQTDEFADDRNAIFSATFSATLSDEGEDHRSRNQGFVLNLTSSGSSSWFGFQLGLVNEASGLVGSSGVGALKLGENMQTWFAGGTTGWTFGSWQAVASAYVGLTQADDEVQGSLFVDMSSLISSTMSFGVRRADIFSRGDRFSLFITQPLRVESGAAKLRFAVARTRYGDVILSETQADLSPSGREIELEASYFYPLSAVSKLTLAAGVIRDRGHEAGAPLEARMMARWQLKF